MDKYELTIKTDQMKKLIGRKDYVTAAAIADTIDWKKVKNTRQLLQCADVYHETGHLAQEKEVLLIAYDRMPMGRQIAYRLCMISIEMGDFEDAEDFYEDFVELAPADTAQYLLKYSLLKAEKADISEQIAALEAFTEEEMEEQWAAELAGLYLKNGQTDKCLAMCDDVMLWFQEGEYVKKVIELKKSIAPLTKSQQALYERLLKKESEPEEEAEDEAASDAGKEETAGFAHKEESVTEDIADIQDIINAGAEAGDQPQKDGELNIPIPTTSEDLFRTMDLQEEIARNMAEILKMDEEEAQNRSDVSGDTEQALNAQATKELKMEEQGTETGMPEIREEQAETEKDIAGFLKPDSSQQADLPVRPDKEPKPMARQTTGQINLEEALRSLQAMGILKEETVNRAVEMTTTSLPIAELDELLSEVEDALEEGEEAPAAEVSAEADQEESGAPENHDNVEDMAAITDEEDGDALAAISDILDESMNQEEDEPEKDAADASDQAQEQALVDPLGGNRFEEMRRQKKREESTVDEDVLRLLDNIEEEKPVKKNLYESYKAEAAGEEHYYLADEYKDIFKRYLRMSGVENQIATAMKNVVMQVNLEGTSVSNNIIITGEAKSGKTALALEMLKIINKERNKEGRKAAKVSSSVINRKGLEASMPKLLGMDLIIGDAGSLSRESVIQMMDVMRRYTADMIVILMDTKKSIDHLLAEQPMLETMFPNAINLHEYDINEWVTVAKEYARKEGYFVDDMGTLALYEKVDSLYGLNRSIEVSDMEALIDNAIRHSERFSIGKLFRGKKKEGSLRILREEDFV